jgi:fatty acid desaturase
LTEPGIDPESNYLDDAAYRRLPACIQPMWIAQRTVLGRVLLGPLMVIVPTWVDSLRKPLRRDFTQSRYWATHLLLLAAMLVALDRYAHIGPLRYLLTVCYPALGMAMLRSFYEHRPATTVSHRVVINEAGLFWRILYLNNNYHAVHHERPDLPWYLIRRFYLQHRSDILRRNGGFVIRGYLPLMSRYAMTTIDSPIHPTPRDRR